MKKRNTIILIISIIAFIGAASLAASKDIRERNRRAAGDNEPDTAIVATEVEKLSIDEETGQIVDAQSGDVISDEELEQLKSEGMIKESEDGDISINEDKNKEEVKVTIDKATGEVVADSKATDQKAKAVLIEEVKKAQEGSTKQAVAETDSKSAKTAEAATEAPAKRETVSEKTEAATKATTEKTTQAATTQPATEKSITKAEATTEKTAERAIAQATTEKAAQAATTQPTTEKSTTKSQTTTEKATQATTERATAQTTTEAPHTHQWVWKTHTETVHHDEEYGDVLISEAWDTPIEERHSFCKGCGLDLTVAFGGATTDAGSDHLFDCDASYGTGYAIVGYEHHDAKYANICVKAAYDETITVKDYEYCTTCGEKK